MSQIHKTKQRLKACLKRISKLKSKKDRELILRVKDEAYANGLSDNRVLFYLNRLQKLSEWTDKDLKNFDKNEIKNLVAQIERKSYSERTKKGYKTSIKKFYQILEGYEWKSRKYPGRVEWIKTTLRTSRLKDPIILSKEEIISIFRCAEGLREKTLISFIYESGCRSPDELLNIRIGDIDFDEYGAKVTLTSGKVGQRKIRVVSCIPRLKDWLESHPNPSPDNWLWVNENKNKNGRMTYQTLKRMVRKWSEFLFLILSL